MKMTPERAEFIEKGHERHGPVITRKEVLDLAKELGHPVPTWLLNDTEFRYARGEYSLPIHLVPGHEEEEVVVAPKDQPITVVSTNSALRNNNSLVPVIDPLFVKFGFTDDLIKILKSGIFYPVFITGLSGNGKTFGVSQACAQAGVELIRANIVAETDEDDLIGGYRLVDGNTVWQDGPAIEAMKRGAKLLLDEVDLGTSKILCLQSILEGAGYFVKKTGEYVTPAPGFNVVATANTKGKGSDDGRFMGTQTMNEAFLERFAITVEQEYPSMSVEKKILNKIFKKLNLNNPSFIETVVRWANAIRETYYDDAVDEVISTRRLVHISNALQIFGDEEKAVKMCLNRFDAETSTGFFDLFKQTKAKVKEEIERKKNPKKFEDKKVEEKEDRTKHVPF
tara:strand:+ start:20840 stop:22027 length:1188 start_codon:yes stop_codon:yes gene_type:complete